MQKPNNINDARRMTLDAFPWRSMKNDRVIIKFMCIMLVLISSTIWIGYGSNAIVFAPDVNEIELKVLPGSLNSKERFASYYEPVRYDIKPDIPGYMLPVSTEKIINYGKISNAIMIAPKAVELLKKNGFAVIDYGQIDDIVQPYKELKKKGIPIFVTSDTVLHLYHIQFDETLKTIEEKEFIPDITKISYAMMQISLQQYQTYSGELKEAARRNAGFFAVALKLLKQETPIPACAKKETQWELDKIEKHEGFPGNPLNDDEVKKVEQNSLFRYMDDYSQYIPRGHYTRSEALKKYFKAMMWYGRMTFLLKGKEPHGPVAPPAKALVSPEIARIHTLQANLIVVFADKVMIDKRTVLQAWDRIYLVTAYYVGNSDDLSIYEYRNALSKVFGTKFKPAALNNEKKLNALKVEFAQLPSPKIYGGTGQSGSAIVPGESLTVEQLDRILDNTKGMRFMGQRFVPDSYIMSQLVSPAAGLYMGKGNPFTKVVIDEEGSIRGFPMGLDVMAILGSRRAKEILAKEGETEYASYADQFNKLKKEFDAFDRKEWNKNLYWSWLYSLKALLGDYKDGYQSFMTTQAWHDKELNAALASWSFLRHDTILYVKQSYTPTITITSAMPAPVEKPVVGYVEPVAEFYARLVALARMTNRGLKDLNVLDESSLARLNSLESILSRLLDISKKELLNQELTEEDYAFIRNFGEQLESAVAGVESKGMKTTIIADVHTDQNTKQCLEDGTGYVNLILAAYAIPDGRIILGAGPVYSYYEFKHPMADRLTDEKWQSMLQSGKKPPRRLSGHPASTNKPYA